MPTPNAKGVSQEDLFDNMRQQIEDLKAQVANLQGKQPDPSVGEPGYLPPHHATESITRLTKRGVEQSKDTQGSYELPESAKVLPLDQHEYVAMPYGGIPALAHQLYPNDVNNTELMDNHIFDLMTLNRHQIRNDTTYTPNMQIRIK